jgi:hypothetical protein
VVVKRGKTFPTLAKLIEVMTPLAASGLRRANTSQRDDYNSGKPYRWFRLDGEDVTKAGEWPQSWWQSFKDMLNDKRLLVSSALSSQLPEEVVLDYASSRCAWFFIVEKKKARKGVFS